MLTFGFISFIMVLGLYERYQICHFSLARHLFIIHQVSGCKTVVWTWRGGVFLFNYYVFMCLSSCFIILHVLGLVGGGHVYWKHLFSLFFIFYFTFDIRFSSCPSDGFFYVYFFFFSNSWMKKGLK
jgi:hypothetical protein